MTSSYFVDMLFGFGLCHQDNNHTFFFLGKDFRADFLNLLQYEVI
jgi:hypothetical protein